MEIFLVLVLLFSLESGVHPVDPVEVTGYEGGSAVIRCSYGKGYERNSKYLCRGKCPFIVGKDVPIWSEAGQTKAVNGRFTLLDNNTARVFTLTITELTAKDSGKYWCGIETGTLNYDVYTELKLNVLEFVPRGPTPVEPATAEQGPSSLNLTVGTVAGIIVVLIAIAALLLFHFRKRQKDSQTLDHVTTSTGNLPASTTGTATDNSSPDSVDSKYWALEYSNSAISTTQPQVDSKYWAQMPSDSASASASPDSVYQTMTAVPMKAKKNMTFSVKSVNNEYITMGPPLSTEAITRGDKRKYLNLN